MKNRFRQPEKEGRRRSTAGNHGVWERFVLASRCFSSGTTASKIDRIALSDVGRRRYDNAGQIAS
ncbi:MAG: hypothetical protein P8X90_31710, partial [Desulfobacterales bacterium]